MDTKTKPKDKPIRAMLDVVGMPLECFGTGTNKKKRSMKQVLTAIASHADADGTNSYPSLKTLIKETGFSKRGLQNIIGELIGADRLKVDSKKGYTGPQGRTNLYTILFEKKNQDNKEVKPGDGAHRVPRLEDSALLDGGFGEDGALLTEDGALWTAPNRPPYRPGIPTLVENNSTTTTTTTDTLESVVVAESIPDGNPGDGSQAYAKIVSELTGEAVQPKRAVQPKSSVQPKPKSSVQPSVMKFPPAPASPPLWETWTGDSGGFSESRIKFCIWHQIVAAKNDYYIKNLSVGYIRRQVHKLDEDTPAGDVIPKSKPPVAVANPACPKCRGTGQLKARFVKVPGQRIEQTIIPSCDCLRIPGAK